MKKLLLLLMPIALAILTSCNQVKISNDEAKSLIIQTLNLPQSYRHDINKRPTMGSGFELDALRKAGLITGSEILDSRRLIEIQITETGKSSFLGESNDSYMFKTNDLVFDTVTGVSINKEAQTATIRFSLKAINCSLAAYALAKTSAGFSGKNFINYSLINPILGELVFKKFDKSWQLLDQGKSGSELLNQILNSEINSNKNDDYSKLVTKLEDEIFAKANAGQAHYRDITEFMNAFKKAILTNSLTEVSKFLNFPFFCDYGLLSKDEFLSSKFVSGIKYFDIFLKPYKLIESTPGFYNLEGSDNEILKDRNGYWKLNACLIKTVRGD